MATYFAADAPLFPLVYVDDDGSRFRYHDTDELEVNVEFADDHDPQYSCTDAWDRRVRLVVWRLTLLLAQVVPDDFDSSTLRIATVADGRGVHSFETHGLLVLRSLLENEIGKITAHPAMWESAPLLPTAAIGPISETSALEEFNQKWMHARTKDRFWRGSWRSTR